MVKQSSGTCRIPLTEEECKSVSYAGDSYTWEAVKSESGWPTGCYVGFGSSVYYNNHPSGKECTGRWTCLCKPGMFNTYDMSMCASVCDSSLSSYDMSYDNSNLRKVV